MFLNIKSWLHCILFIPLVLLAQQEKETRSLHEGEKTVRDYLFVISGEAYRPFPVGNNVGTEAYHTNFGGKFSFQYNVAYSGILVGSYLNFNSVDITNTSVVGNYKNSKIAIIGFLIGYQHDFHKTWRTYLGLGVGDVSYNNEGFGYTFEDSGTAVWFNLKAAYYPTDFFGVYLSGTFRKDILNLDAPTEIRKNFNVSYISFGLGLQFRILNNRD